MYKSEQLAHSIRQLIESGTLNAHETFIKIQVQRSGFSLMTVMNAYQELESGADLFKGKVWLFCLPSNIVP